VFAEERQALPPLPVEPSRNHRYGLRTVHLDRQRVQVQWTDLQVRLSA
jgi:hypothetical protein